MLHLITLSDPHNRSVGIIRIGPLQNPLLDNTKHSQQGPVPMPLAGFEPAIPESELPRARTLDLAAIGIGAIVYRDLSALQS